MPRSPGEGSVGTRALVATESEVLVVDASAGTVEPANGLEGLHPTSLISDPWDPLRAWCGTTTGGVYRSEDAGVSWQTAGLETERISALAVSSATRDQIWAGTEPSAVWRSDDSGRAWMHLGGLENLPSSSTWAFPPRPATHHVRWIALHPGVAGRAWIAIEAGALVSTADGGRSWRDRVPSGPFDTHELAIHSELPHVLRVSAGDGYFESRDGGASWLTPREGLDVGYLRSVTIDPGNPDTVLVSAASRARSAYVADRSDGRVYRRVGAGPWSRVMDGWPDPPRTIAPLLSAGHHPGEIWAADERGVHRSTNGGVQWAQVVAFENQPLHLRGLAVS